MHFSTLCNFTRICGKLERFRLWWIFKTRLGIIYDYRYLFCYLREGKLRVQRDNRAQLHWKFDLFPRFTIKKKNRTKQRGKRISTSHDTQHTQWLHSERSELSLLLRDANTLYSVFSSTIFLFCLIALANRVKCQQLSLPFKCVDTLDSFISWWNRWNFHSISRCLFYFFSPFSLLSRFAFAIMDPYALCSWSCDISNPHDNDDEPTDAHPRIDISAQAKIFHNFQKAHTKILVEAPEMKIPKKKLS